MLIKKIKYKFDQYMSQGAKAQFGLLIILFLLLVVIVGIIVSFISGNNAFGNGMWTSLMHLIDPGTITGDEINNYYFIAVMMFLTVTGMVLTGALIAIINNALDLKLNNLRKGKSQIIEKDHTVIIGFDDSVYAILRELVMANENAPKRQCIVVIDENTDKETMEKLISDHIKKHKKTKIICRSGKIVKNVIYQQVSLENSKSIIVNHYDDFQIVRILLVVTTYLKEKGNGECRQVITTLLHEQKSINAAKYVVKDFPESRILYFEQILARIMAQVCRQPGLSGVLGELFSYRGNEFYLEAVEKLDDNEKKQIVGMKFSDAQFYFQDVILIGLKHKDHHNLDGKVVAVNPKPDILIDSEDKLIILEWDDDKLQIKDDGIVPLDQYNEMCKEKKTNEQQLHFIIFDWNKSLPTVICSLNDFVSKGSTADIVSDRQYSSNKLVELQKLSNIKVNFVKEPKLYEYETMESLLIGEKNVDNKKYTNVLLVCEDGIEKDEADAQTAMLLLHLRQLIEENEDELSELVITSEMNTIDDQNLLQIADVNDFVVGSEIANRIMAQISNEPYLEEIYMELLDAGGSEIYINPLKDYISDTVKKEYFSFRDIRYIVYNQAMINNDNNTEIAIGCKYIENGTNEIKYEINMKDDGREIIPNDENTMVIVVSMGASGMDEVNTELINEMEVNEDLDGTMQQIKNILMDRLV